MEEKRSTVKKQAKERENEVKTKMQTLKERLTGIVQQKKCSTAIYNTHGTMQAM